MATSFHTTWVEGRNHEIPTIQMENKSYRSTWFETITLQHEQDLYRAARALLRNDDDARDTVQETLFQAYRCFDRFEAGTNIRAWLFSILVNVVRHYRRKYLDRWQQFREGKIFEETLRAPQKARTELSDKRILMALDRIPRAYAAVVLLSDVQDFSYREISEHMGIPVGTVMSRLSRGRRLLRDQLWGEALEYGLGVGARHKRNGRAETNRDE